MTIPPVRDSQYLVQPRPRSSPSAPEAAPARDFQGHLRPTGTSAPQAADQQALVFNQNGYFASPGRAAGQQAAGPEHDSVSLRNSSSDGSDDRTPPATPSEAGSDDAASPALRCGLGHSTTEGKGVSVLNAVEAKRPVTRPQFTPSVEMEAQIALEATETVQSEAPPAPLPDGRTARDTAASGGATLNAQLRLAPAGEQLAVSARVDRLTSEERARLRGEIQRLLAQYGISASEIVLNGRIESAQGSLKRGR